MPNPFINFSSAHSSSLNFNSNRCQPLSFDSRSTNDAVTYNQRTNANLNEIANALETTLLDQDDVHGQTLLQRYRNIASKGFIIDEARKPGIKYSVVMSKPDGAYKVNNSRQRTLNAVRNVMDEIIFYL